MARRRRREDCAATGRHARERESSLVVGGRNRLTERNRDARERRAIAVGHERAGERLAAGVAAAVRSGRQERIRRGAAAAERGKRHAEEDERLQRHVDSLTGWRLRQDIAI